MKTLVLQPEDLEINVPVPHNAVLFICPITDAFGTSATLLKMEAVTEKCSIITLRAKNNADAELLRTLVPWQWYELSGFSVDAADQY